MISDLELAGLCAESYSASPKFDFIDDGAQTGIWVAVKHYPDVDVVVFRGSDSVEDWLRDFDTLMVDVPGLGLVHEGFFKNMLNVRFPELKGGYVITGHSLGAARAALLAAFNPLPPSKVTLFGCPRPGGERLKTLLAGVPIFSYKNRHDPVTDVPLPLMAFPYWHVRDQIQVNGDGPNEWGLLKDHHIAAYIDGMQRQ